jgi:hypothetical protein
MKAVGIIYIKWAGKYKVLPVDFAPKLFEWKRYSIHPLIALQFLMSKEYPIVQCNLPLSIRCFLVLQAST